ncbi:DNA repair protein rad16 [Globomyces sp. JEL0801]|nr:DNA repair protein rad16 [Globomyces sp. JEL0801]
MRRSARLKKTTKETENDIVHSISPTQESVHSSSDDKENMHSDDIQGPSKRLKQSSSSSKPMVLIKKTPYKPKLSSKTRPSKSPVKSNKPSTIWKTVQDTIDEFENDSDSVFSIISTSESQDTISEFVDTDDEIVQPVKRTKAPTAAVSVVGESTTAATVVETTAAAAVETTAVVPRPTPKAKGKVVRPDFNVLHPDLVDVWDRLANEPLYDLSNKQTPEHRTTSQAELEKYDVVLTSYAILESGYRKQMYGTKEKGELVKRKSLLHKIHWGRIVLDEAHAIKDRSSSTAKAAFALQRDFQWSLSGTPLQNRVGELYSLIRLLNIYPYSFYFCRSCDCRLKEWHFSDRTYCDGCGHTTHQHFCWWNKEILKPIQDSGTEGNGLGAFKKLNTLLDRIMLRRTKVEKNDELGLPPRIVVSRRDYFNDAEEELYESLYTETTRVHWRLSRGGFNVVKLDGRMGPTQRANVIEKFTKDPTVTVFLISLKAGGIALNLTEASQVFGKVVLLIIVMDPWWNPAVEDQAMDRIHRLGQHRPIKITRMIIENSIESRILELQQKKKALFDSTVGKKLDSLSKLSQDDLRFLFVL